MSIAQVSEDVKQECIVEGCAEEVFRWGLCWEHFKKEVVQEWDAQDAEREASSEGVGYLFGDEWEPALDGAWWGYPVEEVCR